jgi:hypothetical protein
MPVFLSAGSSTTSLHWWGAELKFFPGDKLGAQKESNGHQDPWTSWPYIFPSGVIWSHLHTIPAHVQYNWWPTRKYPHWYYKHHSQNLECVWCCMWYFINLCEQQEGQWIFALPVLFPTSLDLLNTWYMNVASKLFIQGFYSDILFGIIN